MIATELLSQVWRISRNCPSGVGDRSIDFDHGVVATIGNRVVGAMWLDVLKIDTANSGLWPQMPAGAPDVCIVADATAGRDVVATLLTRLPALARGSGHGRLFLQADRDDNHLRLYRSAGFCVVGYDARSQVSLFEWWVPRWRSAPAAEFSAHSGSEVNGGAGRVSRPAAAPSAVSRVGLAPHLHDDGSAV